MPEGDRQAGDFLAGDAVVDVGLQGLGGAGVCHGLGHFPGAVAHDGSVALGAAGFGRGFGAMDGFLAAVCLQG